MRAMNDATYDVPTWPWLFSRHMSQFVYLGLGLGPWSTTFADEGLGASLLGPKNCTAYTETKSDADGIARQPIRLALKG